MSFRLEALFAVLFAACPSPSAPPPEVDSGAATAGRDATSTPGVDAGFVLDASADSGTRADADRPGLDAAMPPDAAMPLDAAMCPEFPNDPLATTRVLADLKADLSSSDHFYDFPFPSDLRLTSGGAPDLSGFPHSIINKLVIDLLSLVPERKGFPVIPVAWFKFTAALPDLLNADETVVPADRSSPVVLIDVDPASPERGRLFPTVMTTPQPDNRYVPANLLAVAARPGFVLAPHRAYAFVVMRAFKDAAGHPLAIAPDIAQLMAGLAPAVSRGEEARKLYAPLVDALPLAGLCANQVAAATVFTTGDVVQDTADLSSALLPKYPIQIQGLTLDAKNLTQQDRYCALEGTVVYPQFQQGTPPFNTQGTFDTADHGLPSKQRDEQAPIVITLPRLPMPAGGYPLLVYFHGSGGLSVAVINRGTWHPETDATKCPEGTMDKWNGQTGCNTAGRGPAYFHSANGVATAGSALPLNPERYPGASETEYLNMVNLAAFRDTFRQGVIEQRLFLEALRKLQIPEAALAGCAGPTLPKGETAFHFQETKVVAQGQSMGGMYTNMGSAVEPRIKAVVPTGAGGLWSYFILKGNQVPGGVSTLKLALGTSGKLTFLHPAMHLLELAWEPAEPMVYMPRLARRPLPGHPVRPIYEPVGKDDSYFPMAVYDAVSLAYGHREAGAQIWPTMQPALALDGLDGILSYPVSQDRVSLTGVPYTGVLVQYLGDGVYDPHAIYSQLDAVKYQYSCFVASFLRDGKATVPEPMPLGTPCP